MGFSQKKIQVLLIMSSYYEGHIDKTKGEDGSKGGEVGLAGVGGGVVGGKCRQL